MTEAATTRYVIAGVAYNYSRSLWTRWVILPSSDTVEAMVDETEVLIIRQTQRGRWKPVSTRRFQSIIGADENDDWPARIRRTYSMESNGDGNTHGVIVYGIGVVAVDLDDYRDLVRTSKPRGNLSHQLWHLEELAETEKTKREAAIAAAVAS